DCPRQPSRRLSSGRRSCRAPGGASKTASPARSRRALPARRRACARRRSPCASAPGPTVASPRGRRPEGERRSSREAWYGRWTLEVEREVMSWEDLGVGARALAEEVDADDYRPDIILAVARGGLLLAATLGYALGVKNTFTMNVEFYTDVDERLPAPMILPPVPELVDVSQASVLIADDVADNGGTLRVVRDFCAGKVAEVRAAVLYETP